VSETKILVIWLAFRIVSSDYYKHLHFYIIFTDGLFVGMNQEQSIVFFKSIRSQFIKSNPYYAEHILL